MSFCVISVGGVLFSGVVSLASVVAAVEAPALAQALVPAARDDSEIGRVSRAPNSAVVARSAVKWTDSLNANEARTRRNLECSVKRILAYKMAFYPAHSRAVACALNL